MLQVPTRVRAFDWLRGIAVLVMVETHALVFLRPDLRMGVFAARLNFINGLVAPSFIFAAGFSLALVQVRTALAPASGSSRALRVRKTVRRVAEVLGVGLLVNYIWFPIRHDPVWLLRLDILPCIAVCLFLALPLMVLLAAQPRALAVVLFLLAAAAFGVAPLFEHVTGPWANVVNRSGSLKPVFPLLPWAGYVFLGGAVGAVAARETLHILQGVMVGLGAVGLLLFELVPFFQRIYPPHEYAVSDPGNHGHRLLFVAALLLLLLVVEERVPGAWRSSRPIRFIELFGTTSLAAYFFHEELLFFQLFGHSLARHFRDACGWGGYGALLLLVWTLTALLVQATNALYPRWDDFLRRRMEPKKA